MKATPAARKSLQGDIIVSLNPYEPSKGGLSVQDKEPRYLTAFALGATLGIVVFFSINRGIQQTLQTYRDALFSMALLHAAVFFVALIASFFTRLRSHERMQPWQLGSLRFAGGIVFTIVAMNLQNDVASSVERRLTPGPLSLFTILAAGVIGGLLISSVVERAARACFIAFGAMDKRADSPESLS